MSISKAGLYIKNIMGVSKEVSIIPWFFVKNHGLRLLTKCVSKASVSFMIEVAKVR